MAFCGAYYSPGKLPIICEPSATVGLGLPYLWDSEVCSERLGEGVVTVV
jgi:hypothetical protein